MRKYLFSAIILFLPLLLAASPVWAVDELNFSESTTIDLSGVGITLTIGAGSIADSMTVNSDNVQFTLSANSSVSITCSGINILDNTLGVGTNCAGNSSLTLPAQSAETVVTVTPNVNNVCASNSGGGSSGSVSTPTPTETPAAEPAAEPAVTPTPATGGGAAETPQVTSEATTAGVAQEGDLVRASDDVKVYVITNGKKKHISSAAAFEAAGYQWSDIKVVEPSTVSSYSNYWTGTLYQETDKQEVYYVENNVKRHIPSVEVFNSYSFNWFDIATVPQGGLEAYKTANLYRAENDTKVYKIADGKKTWVKTAEEFNAAGYKWSDIIQVNSAELNAYPDSAKSISTGTSSSAKAVVIKTTTLRVRSAPSLTANILDAVKQGEKYNLLAEQSGWYKLLTKAGIAGWVFGSNGGYATKE